MDDELDEQREIAEIVREIQNDADIMLELAKAIQRGRSLERLH